MLSVEPETSPRIRVMQIARRGAELTTDKVPTTIAREIRDQR